MTREPNPADARSILVRTTPTGRLVLSRGRAARIEDLAAQLTALAPEELVALREASALIERVAGGTGEPLPG